MVKSTVMFLFCVYRSCNCSEQAVPAQGGPGLHPPGQVRSAGPGHLHHQHRRQWPSGDSSSSVRDFLDFFFYQKKYSVILSLKMHFIVFDKKCMYHDSNLECCFEKSVQVHRQYVL